MDTVLIFGQFLFNEIVNLLHRDQRCLVYE